MNPLTTNSAAGTLETRDGRHVMRYERRLAHPVDRVWAAITRPAELRAWLADADLDLTVGGRVELLGMSQPGVSKHLRVLRDGGFVDVRADAQRRFYELRPGPLHEVDAWLTPYRRLWADRLDALERHLDATADPDPKEPR